MLYEISREAAGMAIRQHSSGNKERKLYEIVRRL